MITVKITNDYSDGHHSEREVVVRRAPRDLEEQTMDEWWQEFVFPHTGDGHGADSNLGSCYTATITAAHDARLVGETHEWID